MNKNTIIWLAVGILAVIGIIAVSYPSQNGVKEGQVAANYDFGTISMAAGKVTHDFEIRNDSSSTLSLDKLYTSCMCTNAYFVAGTDKIGPFGMPGHGFVPGLGQTLSPGGSAKIEVVYDPTAHGPAGIGPVDRIVYLESAGDVKEFEIKATVTP